MPPFLKVEIRIRQMPILTSFVTSLIHSMLMASHNPALIWCMKFPIIMFAQWHNELTGAAAVVMLLLKHMVAFFAHATDHDVDLMTFIYELHPYALKIYRMSEKRTSYVKAIKSYCLKDRQTDRHTLLSEIYAQDIASMTVYSHS